MFKKGVALIPLWLSEVSGLIVASLYCQHNGFLDAKANDMNMVCSVNYIIKYNFDKFVVEKICVV